MSKYPNKKRCKWLKERLSTLSSSDKCVIFFHFNCSGPFSGWWDDNEKEEFANIANKHKDKILCVCVGHHHSSYISEWNGLKVLNGSGDELVWIDTERGETRVLYM